MKLDEADHYPEYYINLIPDDYNRKFENQIKISETCYFLYWLMFEVLNGSFWNDFIIWKQLVSYLSNHYYLN